MLVLAGGDLVLPNRVLTGGSIVIDGPRIAAIESRPSVAPESATLVDTRDCYVVPGFVDSHAHLLFAGVGPVEDNLDTALMVASLFEKGS